MTVAELIAALVECDQHDYTVDVRVLPLADGDDYSDRDVTGVASVTPAAGDRQPYRPRGWVTLELESDG